MKTYLELREAALSSKATQADIDALGNWFDHHDDCSWNGEGYDLAITGEPTGDYVLYPILKQINEDEFEQIGFTFDRDESMIWM